MNPQPPPIYIERRSSVDNHFYIFAATQDCTPEVVLKNLAVWFASAFSVEEMCVLHSQGHFEKLGVAVNKILGK